MMMKTAGGPGLVHPLDFNERKRPRFSRATWIATGIVVAAHAGLGVALYYQRFEMPAVVAPPEGPIIDVMTFRRPPPPKPVEAKTPPAPNPDVNDPPITRTPTETLPTEASDKPVGDTTVFTTDTLVDIVAPDSTTTEPVAKPAPVIRNPSWSRQPSADQMMDAYPRRAVQANVSGSASLNCLVLPTGGVTDCNVTRETPDGYGFGRAAQSLSRRFQINPRTVDGAAEGSRVSINLRFTLPED
ncbi:TonB family protein [Brevundimonas sp.]|uniref:TonB family protein n=1 Tax=Brevundimonas sp. TaxID=1871086 RepID=UPI002B67FF51|nr:TonB family protein [Brevundimonas sp.]HWQ85340.1 TonB family protein [Brevundimonas sp.]